MADLSRPSMAWVRLRSIFGVGARAEIVRVFLSADPGKLALASLASATNFTKRNIADECESLTDGGVLIARKHGNRFGYSLANRPSLESFVGQIAPFRPNWTAMLNITREMILLEETVGRVSPVTLPVHSKKTADRMIDDLADLGFNEPFGGQLGPSLWPTMQSWAAETLTRWASGHGVHGRAPSPGWSAPSKRKPSQNRGR